MRQAIAFSKTFGIEIPIMSGPNFTLTVKNGILTTNNEPALRAALEKDLNSPIEKDRIMAKGVVATINEHSLLVE
jgi:hypothetical protein